MDCFSFISGINKKSSWLLLAIATTTSKVMATTTQKKKQVCRICIRLTTDLTYGAALDAVEAEVNDCLKVFAI